MNDFGTVFYFVARLVILVFPVRRINKLWLAVVIILFSVPQVHSQGWYMNTGFGYGAAALPNNAHFELLGNTTTYAEKSTAGSFGKGMQFGTAVGYMFSEHFGTELGVSYLAGSNLTSSLALDSSSISQTGSATMLRLTPAIRAVMGKGKLKPYVTVGLVVGLGANMKKNVKTFINNSTEEEEEKFTGGTSFGFTMGVGGSYQLTKRTFLSAEIRVIAQNWAPLQSEVTRMTMNGVDQLPTMSTSSKKVNYVDSYTISPGNIDTAVPRQALKSYLPFSSVGINVSWHYILSHPREVRRRN